MRSPAPSAMAAHQNTRGRWGGTRMTSWPPPPGPWPDMVLRMLGPPRPPRCVEAISPSDEVWPRQMHSAKGSFGSVWTS